MDSTEKSPEDSNKIVVRPKNFGSRGALQGFDPELEALGKSRMAPSGKTPFQAKSSPDFSAKDVCEPQNFSNEAPEQKSDAKDIKSKKRFKVPNEISVFSAVIAILMTSILFGAVFFAIGRHFGTSQAEAKVTEEISIDLGNPTELQLSELESALENIQKGLASEAKTTLQNLLNDKAPISSLALIFATAALLEGDVQSAERGIRLSLERGESVSDALMLQAITEAKLATSPEHKAMGSPRLRIDGLLQQSIAADASNARPFFELATLRRFEKRHSEALELLESASNRLGQSDSIMSVNLAKELVKLEQLPDAELAAAVPAGKDAQSLLCAAYAAARLGDPAKAAELVAQAQTVVPPRTFFQLMKDPAFVSWRKEPALEKFFPKQKTN